MPEPSNLLEFVIVAAVLLAFPIIAFFVLRAVVQSIRNARSPIDLSIILAVIVGGAMMAGAGVFVTIREGVAVASSLERLGAMVVFCSGAALAAALPTGAIIWKVLKLGSVAARAPSSDAPADSARCPMCGAGLDANLARCPACAEIRSAETESDVTTT